MVSFTGAEEQKDNELGCECPETEVKRCSFTDWMYNVNLFAIDDRVKRQSFKLRQLAGRGEN